MVEGTLAWYRADLAARRAAFRKMVEDPALSAEQRALWAERLLEIEVVDGLAIYEASTFFLLEGERGLKLRAHTHAIGLLLYF